MPGKSFLRSLTRLVVGGVLNSIDGIAGRLEVWEQEIDSAGRLPEAPALPSGIEVIETSPQTTVSASYPEPTADRTTYALVGLLFHSQDRLEQYGRTAGRAARLAGNWGELLGGPLYRSRWMSPVRHNLDRWSTRGEQQVENWIAAGRRESRHGRQLASAAVTERVDRAIDYLTGNEEVQELVQSQSVSLVDEVIEETRERTVSADNFLEAIVRSMLRRPPRWELPQPPPELKSRAEEHTHPSYRRTTHK